MAAVSSSQRTAPGLSLTKKLASHVAASVAASNCLESKSGSGLFIDATLQPCDSQLAHVSKSLGRFRRHTVCHGALPGGPVIDNALSAFDTQYNQAVFANEFGIGRAGMGVAALQPRFPQTGGGCPPLKPRLNAGEQRAHALIVTQQLLVYAGLMKALLAATMRI